MLLPWQYSLVDEAWSLLYKYLSKTEDWQHYGVVVDRLLAMSVELPQWLVDGMKVCTHRLLAMSIELPQLLVEVCTHRPLAMSVELPQWLVEVCTHTDYWPYICTSD